MSLAHGDSGTEAGTIMLRDDRDDQLVIVRVHGYPCACPFGCYSLVGAKDVVCPACFSDCLHRRARLMRLSRWISRLADSLENLARRRAQRGRLRAIEVGRRP